MHGLVDPQGMLCALFEIQEGKCFHCDGLMLFVRMPNAQKALLATREHVYPHASSGKHMHNNVVLAHAKCNHKRGHAEPTLKELQKATAFYVKMGLTPFITNETLISDPVFWKNEDKKRSKIANAAVRKFYANEPIAKIADIWPK